MRAREDYSRFIMAALVLTIAILVSFELYIRREPQRIAADEKRDVLIAVTVGRSLYAQNCASCHGEQGEGVDAPALNDKKFLANTSDETIFSLISSGVPSTEMPAWSQVHGGPFTDEQVRQLVAFIRSWEPDAPDREAEAMAGDPVEGLVIYNSTCIVCHGENGQGTDLASALNNPERLAQFDDEWYIDTITDGRPSQGMPTWGTVLSPKQVRDIVALLRVWERGETVELPGPQAAITEALHALEEGDLHAAEHALGEATQAASGEVLTLLNEALEAIEAGDRSAAEAALLQAQELVGSGDMGGDGHDDGG
ncbi:MAG: c-type cytochrome [Chloroflexi bacterium]|nr:c-type cytochrome [Chloroflexota bacterium]